MTFCWTRLQQDRFLLVKDKYPYHSSAYETKNQSNQVICEVFLKAEDGLKAREVPVGCVIIYGDNVIASSRNTINETKNAIRHAEINCIDQVMNWCKNHDKDYLEVFKEAEVFVTVEPCIMCCAALRALSVSHVTFGCNNDRFGGCGTVLNVHDDDVFFNGEKLKITSGKRKDEAIELLQNFYRGENPNAPFPKVKKLLTS